MRHPALALLLALVSAGSGLGAAPVHAEEMNLYSTREAPLVEPVIASFTAATGIKVRLTTIEDNLVKRMKAEGDASPADVLMTIGLDKTSQLVANGLTQPLTSALLDRAIPAPLRGTHWIGLSVRPRVVIARVDAAAGAIRYEDLPPNGAAGCACAHLTTRTTSR